MNPLKWIVHTMDKLQDEIMGLMVILLGLNAVTAVISFGCLGIIIVAGFLCSILGFIGSVLGSGLH